LNKLLKTKLREHALVLRGLSSSLRKAGQLSEGDILAALRCKKEELLGEVYKVMTATLGVPPQPNEKFVWDYYDKDGKAGRWEGTAKQFYAVRHKCSQFEGELSLFFPFRHSPTSIIQPPTRSLLSMIHAILTRSFIQ
jgi:aminopeptidase C